MRTILLSILLFGCLAASGQVSTTGNVSIGGVASLAAPGSIGGGGGSCNSIFYTNSAAQNDYSVPSSSAKFLGVLNYDPGGSGVDVCSFTLYVTLVNGNVYDGFIYSNDPSRNFVSLIGSSNNSVTGTGAAQYMVFTFTSPVHLNNGTTYSLVLARHDGANFDGTGNVWQAGDAASYETGFWDSSGVNIGNTTRDIIFAVSQ